MLIKWGRGKLRNPLSNRNPASYLLLVWGVLGGGVGDRLGWVLIGRGGQRLCNVGIGGGGGRQGRVVASSVHFSWCWLAHRGCLESRYCCWLVGERSKHAYNLFPCQSV